MPKHIKVKVRKHTVSAMTEDKVSRNFKTCSVHIMGDDTDEADLEEQDKTDLL